MIHLANPDYFSPVGKSYNTGTMLFPFQMCTVFTQSDSDKQEEWF